MTAQADFEKLVVFDMLESYERVLMVDSDVLITAEADDILAHVPSTDFGAHMVSLGSRVSTTKRSEPFGRSH